MGRRVLIALVASLAGVLAQSATCTQADGPVRCNTCGTEPFTDVNAVTRLPRFSRSFASVSSNIAQFRIFDCPDATNPDTPCLISEDLQTLDGGTVSNPPENSVVTYADGVAMYAAAAFICAVIAPFLALCFCCCRCHITCCLCGMEGGAWCCGRGIPTQKAPDSFCACGFEEISDPLDTVEDKSGGEVATKLGEQTFHYRAFDRWATRACLVVYFGLVLAFAAVGHFYGSVRLTEGMVLVSGSLDSVVPVAAGLHDSMESFVVDLTADGIVPAVRRVNETVHREASPPRIISNVFCVLDGVGATLSGINSITGNVSGVLQTLDNIVASVDSVSAEIPAVNQSVTVVAGLGSSGLNADIAALASTRDRAPGVANQVASALTGVETSLNAFKDPATGLPAVSERLSWYNSRPSEAEARAVSTDMQTMGAGGMEGAPQQAARTAAIGRLDTLSAKAANLTRVPELVSLLNGLNGLVAEFRTEDRAGALLRAINATRDLIAGVPNITRALETANRTSDAIASARAALVPVRRSIVQLDRNVSRLSLGFVKDAAGQLDAAEKIVGCVNAMQPDLDGIGRTVVALPAAVNDLSSQVRTINASLSSARGFIGVASTQADNLDAEIAKFSFGSYLASIDAVLDVNSSGIGSLDQASGVTSAIGAVSLDSVYDSVLSVNATVNRPGLTVNATTLARLTEVAPIFANVSNATAAALAAARSYDRTRCANTGKVCSSGADCTGGALCTSGLSLCVPAANPDDGQAGATSCAAAASCPGTDVCTRDKVVLGGTAVALTAYADASTPDLTGAASSIATLRTSVDSVSGLASARSSISSLNSSLTSVTFNASDVTAQVDFAVASSVSAQASLNAVSSAISGVRARLNIRDQLRQTLTLAQDARQSVESASSALSLVRNARGAVESFSDFWYGALPGLLVNDLSRARLEARGSSDGLAGVLLAVADVVGRIASEAEGVAGAVLNNGSSTSLLPVNITELVDTYAPAIRVVGSSRVQQLGGIHYGLAVAQQLGNTTGASIGLPTVLDPATTPAAGTEGASVFVNARGVAWPQGTICATKSCVNTLVQSLNQDSVDVAISGVTAGVDSTSGGGSGGSEPLFALPFELSREVALSLPLILPVLVALCGCIPVLCMCSCGCQSCCTRCMTCCHQCLSCGCAAILFFFFGVIFFPIVMLAADSCRSGFNVGASYVQGSEANLCGLVTGKFIEPGICRVQISAGSGSTDIDLDIPRLYESLLGEGGCTAAGRTEVVTTFTAIGALSDSLLETGVNSTVVEAASSAGLPLRTPMRLALLTSARSFGSAARNLLTNLGSSALSCDNVNGMVNRAADGVCCGMLGPLYWVVSSYYLIALAMCTLGWGGSVFAYKRLPNKLWGRIYEDAQEMPLMARTTRMGQRDKERSGDRASLSSAMQPRSAQVSPAAQGGEVDHDGIVEGEFQFKARAPRSKPKGSTGAGGFKPAASARTAGAGSQAI